MQYLVNFLSLFTCSVLFSDIAHKIEQIAAGWFVV